MITAQEAGKKLTLMAAVCGLVSLLRRFQAGLAFPLKYLINQADIQFSWQDEFTDYTYRYWLTKISIRAKRSISRVFSLFIVPSPFFVHCPYKDRNNRAESVLTRLKPY